MNTYTSKRADRMSMNLRQTIYLLAAILRRQNEMVKRQTGNVKQGERLSPPAIATFPRQGSVRPADGR